jgi:hypothetical protein
VVGRGTHERAGIGVAAHDAMEDDNVVRFELCRDEVSDETIDTVFKPSFGDQLACGVLVTAGEFDVRGALGAPLQQLELDRSDASADVEHAGSLYVAGESDELE